jgi:hypothetical protein
MRTDRERRDDDEDDFDERPRRRRRRDDADDYFERRGRRREPDIGDDPMMRMILPVGVSGWAVVSGYLGLLSVLLFPGPFALWTGILAIREIKRNPRKHGMGRSVFGIAMGSLGTIGLLFVLAVGGIAALKEL